MRILLPTGAATYETVKRAAEGLDADVVVTGEIASFLTPGALKRLLDAGDYDMAIVSGMTTASFDRIEQETGVPVYRGPRHAADLGMVLRLLGTVELSRTIPADEFLRARREREARERVQRMEAEATCGFELKGVKIGGNSRMKVLAEIMDAHRHEDLVSEVLRYFAMGADIVDLGFGFDATPGDVLGCFDTLKGINGPIAIDTQDPDLIRAAIGSAALVLSLHEGNIPVIGTELAAAGTAVVIVPRNHSLGDNIADARKCGIGHIIADPLLQPAGSGLVKSLRGFEDLGFPVFFGAGNVTELLDADSIGINALLAAMAHECGASVIFTSEHSDKTQGSIREMRRAVEMMVLTGDRPYPKDLGIDLLVIKEKRRRREPPLSYLKAIGAQSDGGEMVYDPKGNMRIGIEDGLIVAVHNGVAIRGSSWQEILETLLQQDRVSLLDHAAYLGKELYKAELALRFGRSFEQDGDF